MQLSDTTLAILKNCSQLQNHILIGAGSTIRSINSYKTTMLKCDVEEVFANEVRLHNLSDFIRMIALFDNPKFEFGVDSVDIYDDTGAKMTYGYSDREDLVVEMRDPPELTVTSEFLVLNTQMSKVVRAAQMNKVEDIGFICDDGRISIVAHNKERVTREYKVDINGTSNEDFTLYLKHGRKCAKLLLLPLDYRVQVGTLNGQVAIRFLFEHEGVKISYLIASEYGSTIGLQDIPF